MRPPNYRNRGFGLIGSRAGAVSCDVRDSTYAAGSQSTEIFPSWALRQRELMRDMDRATDLFQSKYTRSDGTLIWRDQWPGMDGSDDGYESFQNWGLYYAMGGKSDLRERAVFLWEAVTRQFTAYGQIHDEFDGYYDWMHHGEGYSSFYHLGLIDPSSVEHRRRAEKFARLYTVDRGSRSNWDAVQRRMRSPITGSRGPRYETTKEDWSTHRWVLSCYPPPFEDLGVPTAKVVNPQGTEVEAANWEDDAVFERILEALNQRQMRCDVPLNLAATSLVTHAYLLTGEEKFRSWTLDYLEAWAGRIKANDGICPDNIGPNGYIGETMDGKWWGGYYGWRWPHGANTIIEPLTIAASNALLLTGDRGYLEIPRGQIRRLMELGRRESGQLLVPHRHYDDGWGCYRPLGPNWLCQLWYFSRSEEDARLIEEARRGDPKWSEVLPGRGKGDDIHFAPWLEYLEGRFPEYPNAILEAQRAEMEGRIGEIERDNGDPASWDVHHWQDLNPVHTEGLSHLTCGGPQSIYHGGLWHASVRHFDTGKGRPGLPQDVAALVEKIDEEALTIRLANLDTKRSRDMAILGGVYGEHRIERARRVVEGDEDSRELALDGEGRAVLQLEPGEMARVELRLERYGRRPRYVE